MTNTRQALGAVRRRGIAAGANLFAPVGLAVERIRAVRARAQIAAFRQRSELTRRFPGPRDPAARPRLVAVVTHVADPERSSEQSVDRLTRTLDGIVESVGRAELELVLNTVPGRNVAHLLPDHLRDRVLVREHEVDDPMTVGFEAQAEFVRRAADADWFLYTEDDIVLADGLVLEKLAFFEEGAPEGMLLLPHRYELWRGQKTYIDLVSRRSPEIAEWNRLTPIEIGGWKFAEFETPHSGWHCLSQRQLDRLLATGRTWFGKVSFVAARESAATGYLAEAFRLYKPHPDNMAFLEVRHWDTKYSETRHELHRATS